MSKLMTEKDVLRQLDIPDFRHITKDKVMSFASMLPDMLPEVQKKALEQFPEFAKVTLSALEDYKGIIEKALDDNSVGSKQCYDIYMEVVAALKSCLSKEDLPFEEKKFYIEKMMEIAEKADRKDSETKGFNWKIVGVGSVAVLGILGIAASVLGAKIDFNWPKNKA